MLVKLVHYISSRGITNKKAEVCSARARTYILVSATQARSGQNIIQPWKSIITTSKSPWLTFHLFSVYIEFLPVHSSQAVQLHLSQLYMPHLSSFKMQIPLLSLLPFTASTLLPSSPQYVLSNPALDETAFKIPTSYESAVQARRILNLTPLGTLSTVFPSPSTLEQRPAGLAGIPIGLMDYFADCESSGDPTILAINIATSFKNVAAGSNISLSLQWTPPYPPKKRIGSFGSKEAVPYSAANLPRFSLLGYIEKIEDKEVEANDLGKCFTNVHPDSKWVSILLGGTFPTSDISGVVSSFLNV